MAARILVVDDEPNARMALVSILREEGYLVDEARDGRAAVEALAVRGADLVLTDLRMPRMGGLELIETVRRTRPEQPFLLMTAHEPVERGPVEILYKPLDVEALLAAIRRHLPPDDG